MRRRISFALASVAFSFSAIGGVPAQQLASTIPAVLQLCPADSVGSCVPVVRAFVAQRQSSASSDVELVDLVAALAAAAQDLRVTRPICLDIADGMRVAGEAMIDAALRAQTFALADALCLGGFETAAIPGQSNDDDDDDDNDGDDAGDGSGTGDGSGAGGDTGAGNSPGGGDDTGDDTGNDDEVDDGNNGHGNDPDGDDDSNPGNGGGGDEGDDDDGNNGHGNDPDGDDDSNPGNGGDGDEPADDDGNNGHGNDPDGDDDSNPGNSGGNNGNGGGN